MFYFLPSPPQPGNRTGNYQGLEPSETSNSSGGVRVCAIFPGTIYSLLFDCHPSPRCVTRHRSSYLVMLPRYVKLCFILVNYLETQEKKKIITGLVSQYFLPLSLSLSLSLSLTVAQCPNQHLSACLTNCRFVSQSVSVSLTVA